MGGGSQDLAKRQEKPRDAIRETVDRAISRRKWHKRWGRYERKPTPADRQRDRRMAGEREDD